MTAPVHHRPLGRAAAWSAAALLLAHASARAAEAPPTSTTAPATLESIGRSFESARVLPATERMAALDELDRSLEAALRRDLDDARRTAARLLAGEIRYERGDFPLAYRRYREAADGDKRNPFADDAAFAAIEALEAGGQDERAAAEWLEWEKRYPQSPLMAEAQIAQSWNLLRRGKVPEARKRLAALTQASAWMQDDPRVAMARATAAYLEGRNEEAIAGLGTRPQGAAALYLSALCHARNGSMLQAAAMFQQVAERHPDSPLRDPALLAKANTFLTAGDHRSAAEEFGRVAEQARDPKIRAEAELRAAASRLLGGASDEIVAELRAVVERHSGTDVAARGQFLVGQALYTQNRYAEAIVELNRVLTTYFQHSVAASAQYRVARCLDALERPNDATSAYQTVVSGYPLEPESPAAAYLAGVGLLRQNRPLAAAPYFQLVLDRYAARNDSTGSIVFATPAHQELVEASLCMLELSYHRAGNLGQLSGAPHVLLQKLPPSRSTWRAHALLIDADAGAAMGRYDEAQSTLERLTQEFPDHEVGAAANKLLAWTYARQGRDSLAIATEERLLARYGASGNQEILAASFLDIAHVRFNQKRYAEAAAAYEDFVVRYPEHPQVLLALYQAGLCFVRLDRAGDAVDRWERIVRHHPQAPLAERAWARAGDLYFQAERYPDAKRCYQGLLEHFATSAAAAIATLRLAQCEYNAGNDAAALEGFSNTIARFPGTPMAREAARGTELALYRLGQSPQGATVLAKLVEQFPTSAFAADAQFQIALRAFQEKRYAEAADGFRRVVRQFPGYSAADRAQFLMADAHTQAQATEDARLAYEQFLAFFPQSELRPTVQFRLGLMQFEAKDHLRAAVSFTSVLQDSASPEVAAAARYNLALCRRLMGDAPAAQMELERYRTLYPGDERAAEVAYQLGDLHDLAERLPQAAEEFEIALAAKPAAALVAEIAYRLGRCRERQGETEAALAAYQKAASTADADNAFRLSAVARTAALYEAKRDVRRAIAAYRDIIRHSKDAELVAAATDRASQLEAGTRKR